MSPRLQVEGEVAFTLEDGGRTTTGRLSGEGSRLAVHTDDPVLALRSMLGPGASRLLPAAAQQLADDGLTVVVTGPHGPLATVGDGVDSLTGRLLVGTRRLRPGSPRAVGPLALAQLRSGHRRPLAVAAGGLGLLAGLLIGLRRVLRQGA